MSNSSPSLEQLLEICRAHGLRRTRCLERTLKYLREKTTPVSIQEMTGPQGIPCDCDTATVYRILSRLTEHHIVRRVGLHERAAHYILTNEANLSYKVCLSCGTIQPVPGYQDKTFNSAMAQSEDSLHSPHEETFRPVFCEMQLYGYCASCDPAETPAECLKQGPHSYNENGPNGHSETGTTGCC